MTTDLRRILDEMETEHPGLRAELLPPQDVKGRPRMLPFETSRDAPIVQALNRAYEAVRGRPQPTGAILPACLFWTDAAHLLHHPTARLGPTGMALGVMPDARYEAMTVVLEPGERLLLYTDGITEATNRADEEYGDLRLEAFVRSEHHRPGRELVDGIVADVLRFCGDSRPNDDMTLMCLARQAR